MQKFSVAVCITTYNQSAYVGAAVKSACAQTVPLEVWVSDDCSTDNTREVLAALQAEFPLLKVELQPHNLGMARHVNALLTLPQTEFIARLDSDDLMAPRYVEELVALLEKYPDAAYAHCAVQEIGKHSEPRRVRRLGGRGEFQDADEALRAQAAGFRVAANICVFRRAALEAVGFYRPAVLYAQDWDLAVRLADAGWDNVYLDEVLASYRVWEDAGQVRPKRKMTEVGDCLRIYHDSILPAFERRNWDVTPVWKARRAMALSHASVLDQRVFSASERHELLKLVRRLGDSGLLRVQTFLLRCGLGPLVRGQRRAAVMLKDLVKKVLALVKSRRQTAS